MYEFREEAGFPRFQSLTSYPAYAPDYFSPPNNGIKVCD